MEIYARVLFKITSLSFVCHFILHCYEIKLCTQKYMLNLLLSNRNKNRKHRLIGLRRNKARVYFVVHIKFIVSKFLSTSLFKII